MVAKLRYYESILSLSNLGDLLVPVLRHLAVAIGLSSRLFLQYPIPTHNLQRLISLMTERVLASRHHDATWTRRNAADHLELATRHLAKLGPRLHQPSSNLQTLDEVRGLAADTANYLAFALFVHQQGEHPVSSYSLL